MSLLSKIGATVVCTISITANAGAQPWTCSKTDNNHIVIIPANVAPSIQGVALVNGDYLGVFFEQNGNYFCAGYEMWTGTSNISLTVWGDDVTTIEKDGFMSREKLQWKMWRRSDGVEVSATATYAETGGIVSHTDTYAAGGISLITEFTVTSILPVELTEFTAKTMATSIVLQWSTAGEVNNYGFDIEKNQFSKWEKIGFVKGSGSSNTRHAYSFTDAAPGDGLIAYRLKQIDRDGRYIYSYEVNAFHNAILSGFSLKQNYPNPFNPTTSITYALPEVSSVTIRVYDMIGCELAIIDEGEQTAGCHTISFDGSALSSGVYWYCMKAIQGSTIFRQTRRMVLQR